MFNKLFSTAVILIKDGNSSCRTHFAPAHQQAFHFVFEAEHIEKTQTFVCWQLCRYFLLLIIFRKSSWIRFWVKFSCAQRKQAAGLLGGKSHVDEG